MRIERVSNLPPGFSFLETESRSEDFRFLGKLRLEWESGRNRFEAEGEALFAAFVQGTLAGIGGLNRDPSAPGLGRIRHLYVLREHRRAGVGAALVERIRLEALRFFPRLRLRTDFAGAFLRKTGLRARRGRFRHARAGIGGMMFFLLWALTAHADPVNLTCTTDPLTTSLAVFTTGSDVTVRVLNHNGVETIPLSTVPPTPHELPLLAEKARVLKDLGEQYDLHFPASQCTLMGNLASCHGAADVALGGHKLSYASFDTAESSTRSALLPGAQLNTTATIALTLDGRDYEFSLRFRGGRCVRTSP